MKVGDQIRFLPEGAVDFLTGWVAGAAGGTFNLCVVRADGSTYGVQGALLQKGAEACRDYFVPGGKQTRPPRMGYYTEE